MKTTRYYLVCLLMTIGFLGIFENSNAQSRKELRREQSIHSYFILDSLINSRSFVFKVDMITDLTYTYRNKHVNPAINFIKIDGDYACLQTGHNSGLGQNGFGGGTCKGKIVSFKSYKDSKDLSNTLEFAFITLAGTYDIIMRVTSDNHATILSGWNTWRGYLTALDNAGIYEVLTE